MRPKSWREGRGQHVVILLAVTLCVAFTLGPTVYSTFALFMVPITEQLGWTRSQLSLALAICTTFAAMAYPLVGMASDRWGSRPVLLFGLLLSAAANACFAAVESLGQLFIVHALIGIGGAASGLVPYSRLLVAWFHRRRGLALGLAIGIGAGVGSAVLSHLARLLIDDLGWRQARLLLSILILAIPLPAALFLLRESAGHSREVSQVRAVVSDERWRWRDGTFWKLAAISFLGTTCLAGIVVHLITLLIDRGVRTEMAVAIFSACMISKSIGHIGVGAIQDRISSPRTGIVIYASALLGIAVMSADIEFSLPAVACGAVLLGLAFGAEVSFIAYLTSRYWSVSTYGKRYGLIYCLGSVGGASGPLLMGAAFDLSGSYQPAIMVFLSIILLCLLLILTFRRYR